MDKNLEGKITQIFKDLNKNVSDLSIEVNDCHKQLREMEKSLSVFTNSNEATTSLVETQADLLSRLSTLKKIMKKISPMPINVVYDVGALTELISNVSQGESEIPRLQNGDLPRQEQPIPDLKQEQPQSTTDNQTRESPTDRLQQSPEARVADSQDAPTIDSEAARGFFEDSQEGTDVGESFKFTMQVDVTGVTQDEIELHDEPVPKVPRRALNYADILDSQINDPNYEPSTDEDESSQSTSCFSTQTQTQDSTAGGFDLSECDWKQACMKVWQMLMNSKYSTYFKNVNSLDEGLPVLKEQLQLDHITTAKKFRQNVKKMFKDCKDKHKQGKIRQDCSMLESEFDVYMDQVIEKFYGVGNPNQAGPSTCRENNSDVSPSKRRHAGVGRINSDDSGDDDDDDDKPADGIKRMRESPHKSRENGTASPLQKGKTPQKAKDEQQNKGKIRFSNVLEDCTRKNIYLDNDALESSDVLKSYGVNKKITLTAKVDMSPAARRTKTNNHLLKEFYIENADGLKIRCVAWNDQAEKYANNIEQSKIIHIKNAQCIRLNETFNHYYGKKEAEGISYELQINGDTEIYVKGNRRSNIYANY